jgi:Uma2 family endonuclease
MASTLTAHMTLEEFERLPDDGNKHELSEGELIVMPPVKSLHSLVAAAIVELLQTYLRQHPVGRALPEAGYVLSRNPLTVRQPDVSVLSNERIAATPEDKYFERSPELAVEVVSPSDSAQDLETKVEQYLRFGAKQVWIVYPTKKRVHVFRPDAAPAVLNESQSLDGGDVLPGFSVKVADLFV